MCFFRNVFVLLMFVVLLFHFAPVTYAQIPAHEAIPEMTGEFVPGEIVVKFSKRVADIIDMEIVKAQQPVLETHLSPSLDELLERFEATTLEPVFHKGSARELIQEGEELNRIYKMNFKNPDIFIEALFELQNDPDVEYAEPNFIYGLDMPLTTEPMASPAVPLEQR